MKMPQRIQKLARPCLSRLAHEARGRALAKAELVATRALRMRRQPKAITFADFQVSGEAIWGGQRYRRVARVLPALGGLGRIRDTYFCEPSSRLQGGQQAPWVQDDILPKTPGTLPAVPTRMAGIGPSLLCQ